MCVFVCVCVCELQGAGKKWPVDTAQERMRGREAKNPGQREETELVARSTSGQREDWELAEFKLYLLERLMEEAVVKVVYM